jgi:hypothetical protein
MNIFNQHDDFGAQIPIMGSESLPRLFEFRPPIVHIFSFIQNLRSTNGSHNPYICDP